MEPSTDPSAGTAVTRILSSLVRDIDERLEAVARDEGDSVHQARIQIRRIRSVLATYRGLFHGAEVDDLRDRLSDLGAALGTARDAEVRATVLENLLTERSAPDLIDAVYLLVAQSRRDYALAHAAVLERLATVPHLRLVRDLDRFAAHPRLRGRASRPALEVADAALAHQQRRVERRATVVAEAPSLEARHELRKSARRLRYAAEAVAGPPSLVFRAGATALAASAQNVQDALGNHRDGLLLAEWLRSERRAAWLRAELTRSASSGIAYLAFAIEKRSESRLDRLDSALRALRVEVAPHPEQERIAS